MSGSVFLGKNSLAGSLLKPFSRVSASTYSDMHSKKTLAKAAAGVSDPPADDPTKKLTYKQIALWSDFVEQNDNIKGLDSMWNAFKAKYPSSDIDKSVLSKNIDILTRRVQDGFKRERGYNESMLNTGLSFPKMVFNNKDYGRVNAMMQTEVPIPTPNTTYPEKFVEKFIPEDVKDFWYDDEKTLWAYEDPHEGTIKYAAKPAGNTEEMKRLAAKTTGRNKN